MVMGDIVERHRLYVQSIFRYEQKKRRKETFLAYYIQLFCLKIKSISQSKKKKKLHLNMDNLLNIEYLIYIDSSFRIISEYHKIGW